jgi:anhydro-N-acetylmuramic acid kinase
MSGTSLDGISAAAVRFVDHADGRIEPTLLSFTQRAYAPDARARLEAAMREGSAREYCRLHADLGDWFADAALEVMHAAHLTGADVAAVASHGQTLWHEPGHSTWQVGDASRIAERCGCAVVADFRARDVAAGGQGAPLVPIADARLFAHATQWRALQNLGGIGNVTVVPPASQLAADDVRGVRAFDTGPGVVVIDGVVRALRPDLPFDRDGALAFAGSPIVSVVDAMMADPFFAAPPPKSTGREWFTREYLAEFIAQCRVANPVASDEDVVATATLFTARSVADQYARFVTEPVRDVLVSGGGAENPALMAAISAELQALAGRRGVEPWRVEPFASAFFDGEAKEAVAFAFLGYLHLTGRSGNVVAATGARGPRVLGHYTPG